VGVPVHLPGLRASLHLSAAGCQTLQPGLHPTRLPAPPSAPLGADPSAPAAAEEPQDLRMSRLPDALPRRAAVRELRRLLPLGGPGRRVPPRRRTRRRRGPRPIDHGEEVIPQRYRRRPLTRHLQTRQDRLSHLPVRGKLQAAESLQNPERFTLGSVRGAAREGCPYRDPSIQPAERLRPVCKPLFRRGPVAHNRALKSGGPLAAAAVMVAL